ncbi:hypothetical protein [Paenibacillus sp. Marseille-Q4541]|uniref:hypothetical protein n=1 Tax=Paenibacillus sp. Marseille-Q4541 TaxID=2831522 RepID=UPI001BADC8F5|nr:hypothetical protein [Paenibacillus sp. Marseille-Q4541]
MRNGTKRGSAVLVALLALMLAACGQNGGSSPSPDPGSDQESNRPSEPEVNLKEASGTFTGLADPHTVEIVLDNGEPTEFQFDESLQEAVAGLQENDTVSIKYEEKAIEGEENVKQLVLAEITKTGSDSGTGSSEGNTDSESRPETKELTLTLEGMTEKKEASLIPAADGYSLYVFDSFTFNPETGLLTMDVDPNYAVKVEKLSSGANLESLKEEGTNQLSEYGTVEELTEEKRPEAMKDSTLFLTAKEEANGTSHQYIVKEMDGNGFVFHVTIPEGEPSEGFEPHVYASLNTIELDSE